MSLRGLFETVYLASAILLTANGEPVPGHRVQLPPVSAPCGELPCALSALYFDDEAPVCSTRSQGREALPVCRASTALLHDAPLACVELSASATLASLDQNSSRRGVPAR